MGFKSIRLFIAILFLLFSVGNMFAENNDTEGESQSDGLKTDISSTTINLLDEIALEIKNENDTDKTYNKLYAIIGQILKSTDDIEELEFLYKVLNDYATDKSFTINEKIYNRLIELIQKYDIEVEFVELYFQFQKEIPLDYSVVTNVILVDIPIDIEFKLTLLPKKVDDNGIAECDLLISDVSYNNKPQTLVLDFKITIDKYGKIIKFNGSDIFKVDLFNLCPNKTLKDYYKGQSWTTKRFHIHDGISYSSESENTIVNLDSKLLKKTSELFISNQKSGTVNEEIPVFTLDGTVEEIFDVKNGILKSLSFAGKLNKYDSVKGTEDKNIRFTVTYIEKEMKSLDDEDEDENSSSSSENKDRLTEDRVLQE